MKSLVNFWKRDIINKLIVITLLVLTGGVIAFGWLIFTFPQGKSLSLAFADFIPARATPTFDINSYLTPNAGAALPAAIESPISLPTFTVLPPTPIVELPTSTPELSPTPTMEILPTPTTEAIVQTPLPPSQIASADNTTCVPQ